jgi:DNA (cytosine-5)-methyltransferase 1
MGLDRAGFNEIIGVDNQPQPNYPYDFIEGDALAADLDGFDFIWASPPCQRWVTGGRVRGQSDRPDLITPIRERLLQQSAPWVIENVPESPLRVDALLCGSMFGLGVRRHRIFECSFPVGLSPPCDHTRPIVGVYGHPHGAAGAWPGMLPGTLETWRPAMGIDWMAAAELTQAIPPAYSEWLAKQWLNS